MPVPDVESQSQTQLQGNECEVRPSPSHAEAQKVRAAFNAPARWMIVAGMVLALCAGIVNVTMFMELGTVVSHVTGHATAIGMHLEGIRSFKTADGQLGDPIEGFSKALMILGSFMFGSYLCGLIIPKNAIKFGGKSFYGIALLGNSILIIVAVLLIDFHQTWLAIALTACASGLQNAMCTLHLGAVVRTTHVTGTTTDIGSTLGRASMIVLRAAWRRRKLTHVEKVEVTVDLEKMSVLLSLLVSFILGCLVGALTALHFHHYALLIPAGLTFTMGIVYWFFREMLKQQMKKYQLSRLEREISEVTTAMQNDCHERDGTDKQDQEEEEMDHIMDVIHEMQEVMQEYRRNHSNERI